LAASDARFAKKSFSDGSNTRSLPDQPIILRVGVAQGIISRRGLVVIVARDLTNFNFVSLYLLFLLRLMAVVKISTVQSFNARARSVDEFENRLQAAI
jgi:hypothetical protein